MEAKEIFSLEEERELKEALGVTSQAEDTKSPVDFLKKVAISDDNRSTAFLTEEELGQVRWPVRCNLELAQHCEIFNMSAWAKQFKDHAQMLSATSLSRDGFLDKLVVTTKKESLIKGRQPPQRRSWFKRKPRTEEENL